MLNLNAKIPDFVVEKSNIVRLVIFTAAFALLFINFYEPFGVRYWFNIPWWKLLFYSSLIILTGVLVVVVSRMIMYVIKKQFWLNYLHYFFWVLGEVFFMALFYTLFEKLILKDERAFFYLLKISVQNTALVLLLPYSAMWLYFSYRDKKIQLDKLEQGEHSSASSDKNMISFLDEKDVLRISMKKDHLLYLEASDNYVTIYYLNKDKVTSYMLRNTLKRMEDYFQKLDIIRCHRSYMVNFDKVKVIRKDKDGLQLELDLPTAIDIPVSRSYVDRVMVTFSKYSTPL